MSLEKPDLRGLTEKGKKAYPRFTRQEIEINECEFCKGIRNVKQYQITKKSGKTEKIYQCDGCTDTVKLPKGVTVICLEETKQEEDTLEFKQEIDEAEEGDSLLI